MKLIQFVGDVELQHLSKVCRHFRSLATDRLLWKKIRLELNPYKLNYLLSKTSRPSRLELVSQNVLKSAPSRSILARHVEQGAYINGPWGVNAYQIGVVLQLEYKKRALNRHLANRPAAHDLGHVISSRLTPKINRLKRALDKDKLRHALENRAAFNELDPHVTHASTGPLNFLHIQVSLHHRLLGAQLRQFLLHRTDPIELEQVKVLPTNAVTAWMQCPSIKSKLAFYERLQHV